MAKYVYNEIKNKKYHIVGTILKSNKIITERGNIHTPSIHIQMYIHWKSTPLTHIYSGNRHPNTYIQ